MDHLEPESNEHGISPLVLAEIVIRFGDHPDPTSRSARFPLRNCRARAYPSDRAGPVDIEIADLSLSGIGFAANVPMTVGDELLIAFASGGIPSQRWPSRVTHTTESRQGVFRVGAVFSTPTVT